MRKSIFLIFLGLLSMSFICAHNCCNCKSFKMRHKYHCPNNKPCKPHKHCPRHY